MNANEIKRQVAVMGKAHDDYVAGLTARGAERYGFTAAELAETRARVAARRNEEG